MTRKSRLLQATASLAAVTAYAFRSILLPARYGLLSFEVDEKGTHDHRDSGLEMLSLYPPLEH